MEMQSNVATALYNFDTRELIGLFHSRELASCYVYDGRRKTGTGSTVISQSVNRGSFIRKSTGIWDYRIKAKDPTPAQLEQLGTNKYLFFNGYNFKTQPSKNYLIK